MAKDKDKPKSKNDPTKNKEANKKVADILKKHAKSEKKEKGDPGK